MTVAVTPVPFDRAALRPRILHIGFGAFARAHPMVYLNQGLGVAGGDWGVVAARLNSGAEALSDLDAADGLYHVAEADGETMALRQIGVLCGTCHPARDGAEALPDLIASPELSLILLTITEKGYCTRGGALDMDHGAIQADLAGTKPPQTAIGVIVAGLERRRASGGEGLTILSCDNQPDNGALTRAAVLGFARARGGDLADWIEREVRFPSSMVDRIVPAMTDESRALISESLGHDDGNAILCEPFRQWVIEDNFVGQPPPFAEGGALLVPDVQPFEDMKLRLLNGAHTTLAWVGQLLGQETVSDCMGNAPLRRAIRQLMLREQAPTLHLPKDVDVTAYADDLLSRFGNTRLKHQLAQIATDSSQKMPQRLFSPIGANLQAGRPWPVSALAIAAWIAGLRHLEPIDDPRRDELRQAASGADPVAAIFGLPDLGPAELIENVAFTDRVRDVFNQIQESGIAHALDMIVTEPRA
ncbi:mannitol dehydrogenase family protein [Phaeobacter sp. B1627]|uniref:mannitol dehydrogenase family protein n=1 Tax=Phaeobacter sp. B1627 TaxID=2583809 RepID=UPI001119096D|nr:mannitol dehydrogenase family protein [Phaeobacter sp. B1627]TNJ41742.1 mannitol dehydrogenase family protein [Phaeobacter sp. B1627]